MKPSRLSLNARSYALFDSDGITEKSQQDVLIYDQLFLAIGGFPCDNSL
jgi:hypothetical protein